LGKIHDKGFHGRTGSPGLFRGILRPPQGKEFFDPFYMDPVFFRSYFAAAGGGTAVNMEIHTGGVPFSQDPAFPQGEQLIDKLKDGIHRLYVGKGAKILGPIFDNMPGPEYPGVCFGGNPYDRIGFAILQVNIVFGIMLFDKGIFQKQRFIFIGNNNGFNGFCLFYQDSGFYILLPGKIRNEPVSKYPGLTHIDDAAFLVPHDIYPRFLGSLLGRRLEGNKIFRKPFMVHGYLYRYLKLRQGIINYKS
jgi:hypothetical protein